MAFQYIYTHSGHHASASGRLEGLHRIMIYQALWAHEQYPFRHPEWRLSRGGEYNQKTTDPVKYARPSAAK
jgi:hypothetical protein